MAEAVKISVLASGELLLEEAVATLADVETRLAAASPETVVLYYRESAASEPPPVATAVMKAITDRRLPLRLTTKPDFSDFITPATLTFEKLFAPIREKAAEGNMVILRPDGRYLVLPATPRAQAPPDGVASVEKMLPSSSPRNVAAIGDTAWTMAPSPDLRTAGQAIPFLGLLMGFSTIGHSVWVFDAPTDLAGGCRLADLLIVDSARLSAFPQGWHDRARQVMRTPQILVHNRATYELLQVK